MSKVFKFLTVIFLMIIVGGFLSIPASANVGEFIDVSPEHLYYRDIMMLADHGVVSGHGDGTFRPDDYISVAEAIVITERVFGNSNNLPEWSKWEELTNTGYVYQTDWEIDYSSFFNKYNLAVNWGLGSQFVLNSTHSVILSPEIFGESNKDIYFGNILFRGYKTDKSVNQIMTRGEFCNLVIWATNYIDNIPNYKTDFPVRYIYIGEKYNEDEKMVFETNILSSFLEAPEWLLEYYAKSNGEIVMVEESSWDMINHKESAAFIDYEGYKTSIYIRDAMPSVALHELGHFIWFKESLYLSKDIMEEEYKGLKKVSQSSYCKTNIKEYFAEAFQCYFLNYNSLKEEAPSTFEFVDKVIKNLEQRLEN